MLRNLIPAGLAVAAAVALALWFQGSPRPDVARRVPAVDPRQESEEAGGQGRLIEFGGTPADIPGSWQNFRGNDFTNTVGSQVSLDRRWAKGRPPVLWQIEVGEGHAGAAVLNGRVYVLDYDPPDTWLLRDGDVKDWALLAAALKSGAAAAEPGPAKRVWGRLAPGARAALEEIAAGGALPADSARAAVLAALNEVLQERDLYDEASFASVRAGLTGEAERLLANITEPGAAAATSAKEKGNPREVRRFNRILLELAWPDAIVQSRHGDVLRCLSLADGRDIWRYFYPVKVKRNHGMSRTVPAVTDKYVLAMGPKCHVVCLDSSAGKLLWRINLVTDYGTKEPLWYGAQCPLIDRGRAILAPAGKVERIRNRDPKRRSTPVPTQDILMMAVDCATGKVLWTTPNAGGWEMTHSSIVPMDLGGRHMYVYSASGGVVGVDAEDGHVLWQTEAWRSRNPLVATPVILGDGRIFLSGGYGIGSMMLRVRQQGGDFVAEPLWTLDPKGFGSTQQTPVLYEGHIYGVLPSNAGALKEQLVCMDLDGKHVWESGSQNRFGIGGPVLVADGLLYVMNDDGRLTVAEATPNGYKPLASADILEHGHDSWGPIALVGGRLIARDYDRMVCLDVSARGVAK